MLISEQQKIFQAAMAASGAFKPKYIIERTELAYGTVVVKSDRLVQKTILVKDKKNKTSTCSMSNPGIVAMPEG